MQNSLLGKLGRHGGATRRASKRRRGAQEDKSVRQQEGRPTGLVSSEWGPQQPLCLRVSPWRLQDLGSVVKCHTHPGVPTHSDWSVPICEAGTLHAPALVGIVGEAVEPWARNP